MTAPTKRGALLFAATLPLAIMLVAWSPKSWLLGTDLALVTLGAMALDALLCLPRARLTVTVETPTRLFIGTAGRIHLVIAPRQRFRRARFELIAEQRGPAAPAQRTVASRDGDGVSRATLPLGPERRGKISIDAVWLRWSGPLGLVARSHRQVVDRTVDVLPDVRGIESAALEFFSKDAIDGVKVQHHKGEGAEFYALRDHAPGLDNRFIDWKRSAKHRRLISREFKAERNHQVVLAFDTGYLMCEPIDGMSRLDHAINAGLLLGWIALRHGDFVGSYAFDALVRQYMEPTRGLPYFTRLQRASAGLDYHAEETNFTLGLAELNVRLKRRALVILFTEFVDTTTAELLLESLQRMVNRHAVVFVTLRDPLLAEIGDAELKTFRNVGEAVAAHDLSRERAIVLERLARIGVHCLDVPSDGLGVGLVNCYLRIKQRGLL